MKKEQLTGKLLNLFAFLAMVFMNILAQILPLNGKTTAEVSALYPTLLTPAGITFSIWSVIYILLGIFVIRQFTSENPFLVEKTGLLFALSCGLNLGWIVFWHFEKIGLATFALILLWIALYILNRDLKGEDRLTKAAFSVYYGWITAATLIQLFVFLSQVMPVVHLEKVALTITLIALLFLTLYAAFLILKKKDYLAALALMWAIIGIFISHVGIGYNKMYPVLIGASGLCVIFLLLVLLWAWTDKKGTAN